MIRTVLFVAALVASSAAAAAPPRVFLTDAIKGDNSEARLGRVIAQRGASPAVRNFGNVLTSDHSAARVQAAAVARRMGVPVPGAMTAQAHSEFRLLLRMRGHAFDREVRRYMINDHREDIAKFVAQARTGDPRTAALARAQLPTLRKHLRIAESLPR
jgi:putative membrane protein